MRKITPKYHSNVDNVTITFRVDPRNRKRVEDAGFDVLSEVTGVVHRYQIQIGTAFDIVFLDDAGEKVIATQRWMVTEAREEIVSTKMNAIDELQRNVTRRRVAPISDLFYFQHEEDASITDEFAVEREPTRPAQDDDLPDLGGMNPAELQKLKKQTTGRGFRPGTSADDMRENLREIGAGR